MGIKEQKGADERAKNGPRRRCTSSRIYATFIGDTCTNYNNRRGIDRTGYTGWKIECRLGPEPCQRDCVRHYVALPSDGSRHSFFNSGMPIQRYSDPVTKRGRNGGSEHRFVRTKEFSERNLCLADYERNLRPTARRRVRRRRDRERKRRMPRSSTGKYQIRNQFDDSGAICPGRMTRQSMPMNIS